MGARRRQGQCSRSRTPISSSSSSGTAPTSISHRCCRGDSSPCSPSRGRAPMVWRCWRARVAPLRRCFRRLSTGPARYRGRLCAGRSRLHTRWGSQQPGTQPALSAARGQRPVRCAQARGEHRVHLPRAAAAAAPRSRACPRQHRGARRVRIVRPGLRSQGRCGRPLPEALSPRSRGDSPNAMLSSGNPGAWLCRSPFSLC